ncbi:MAG: serine/threonine-protein phosphatase [bacterium]|nr:serine/threonine-protein phosphatase [bacterium]
MKTSANGPGLELVCSEVWGGNRFVETPVRLPGLSGWIYSRPCEGHHGGDVHYLSTCSAGLLTRVCLADVVGHGQQVAQMSGWIHRLLKKYMSNPDPQRILSALNRQAVDAGFKALTTAALTSYYAPTGVLRYGYAGHPPILHFEAASQSWTLLRLNEGGSASDGDRIERPANMPLGVEADIDFDVGQVTLSPGDRLAIFSDGVLETASPDGELFSNDRLRDLLHESRDRPAGQTGSTLIDALRRFAGHQELTHDDVTLIVLDVGPRPRAPKILYMIGNQMRRLWGRLTGVGRTRRSTAASPPR